LIPFLLVSISSRSPIPSENFAPRYKENGGNASLLWQQDSRIDTHEQAGDFKEP